MDQTFFRRFRPDAVGANVTVQLVDGGLNDQSIPGTEVNHHLCCDAFVLRFVFRQI